MREKYLRWLLIADWCAGLQRGGRGVTGYRTGDADFWINSTNC